eukprot:3933229-Rhodomonas_salina.3
MGTRLQGYPPLLLLSQDLTTVTILPESGHYSDRRCMSRDRNKSVTVSGPRPGADNLSRPGTRLPSLPLATLDPTR